MRPYLLPLILGLACHALSVAMAEDAAAKPKADPQTLYILRVFTVPKAQGLDWLAKDLDDGALHQLLMEEAKKTPAVLEKLLLAASDNTEAVDLQQADELLSPTEFDPQQLPQKLAIGSTSIIHALQEFFEPPPAPAPTPMPAPPEPKPSGSSAPPGSHPSPLDPARTKGSAVAGARAIHPINGGIGIITAITPTAFQMDSLGEKWMLSPSISPAGVPKVTVNLECRRLAGFQDYNGEPLAQISTRTLRSEMIAPGGTPCFLGTFTASQRTGSEFEAKEDTVSLAFITARPTPITADGAKAATNENPELSGFLEVISLPKNEASALVEESLDDVVFHDRLKAAITTGPARLEAFLSGRVGLNPATPLEEADEYLYPTEFNPPQTIQTLLIDDEELLADLRAGRQTGTGAAPPNAGPHNGGFGLMTKPTATAFTTRMLGTKLEIDVTRDGQRLTLTLKPQLTRLIGEQTYVGITQPMFESQYLATTTTARIGTPHLIGTLSRPTNTGIEKGNKEDRVWFAFITVREVK